jgi:hypothetical protein
MNVRIAALVIVVGGSACAKGSASAPSSANSAVNMSAAQTVAGIRFAPPVSWKQDAPRPMRVATYQVPAAKGDAEGGECGVFYFGGSQGGSVDANLARWLGQFTGANGHPVTEFARKEKRDVHGIGVTTVDLSGTFLFSPTPMSPDKTPKPGYRMLGAIIEAPEGNVFVKLTGPAATIGENAAAFEAMLQSVAKP